MTEFGENQTRDFAGNLASLPRLVDLGVILAADCTGGNSVDLQPLIDAPVGAMVRLVIVNADFVQHDSDAPIFAVIYGEEGTGITWSQSSPDAASVNYDSNGNSTYNSPYIEDGEPLLFVGSGSLATVGAIHLKALVVG